MPLVIGAIMHREWFEPFQTAIGHFGAIPVWLGETLDTFITEQAHGLAGIVVELSPSLVGDGAVNFPDAVPVAGLPVAHDSEALASTCGIAHLLYGQEQAGAWLKTLEEKHHLASVPVLCVWGTPGAPGATTFAIQLAIEVSQSFPTILIDADFVAPSVAELLIRSGNDSGLIRALRIARNPSPSWESLVPCATSVEGIKALQVFAGIRPGSLGRVEASVITRVIDSAVSAGVAVVVEAKCSWGGQETSPEKSAVRKVLERANRLFCVTRGTDLGISRLVRDWSALSETATDFSTSMLVRASNEDPQYSFEEVSATLWKLTGCSNISELIDKDNLEDASSVG